MASAALERYVGINGPRVHGAGDMPRRARPTKIKGQVPMPLLLALIIVPIIEIALFIQVGGAIGLWPTIAIVIATAVLGSVMLRSQGAGAMRDLQRSMSGGGDPGKALANGAMILVSGVLLLTPGFFTDGIGFALLLPPVRAAIIRWGVRRFSGSVHVSGFSASVQPGAPRPPADGDVIDGDWKTLDDDAPSGPPGPPNGWTRPPE
ncbi:MAG: UPF0716 protein FxsA [Paracoccaceae bacterium]|jgi:UPF0716 protein FxsA